MNKAELVAAMATKAGLTKADAERALDAFQEVVVGAVKKDDGVTLVGFGSFVLKKKPARNGRNPATGETIKIPARKAMQFKTSPALNKQF